HTVTHPLEGDDLRFETMAVEFIAHFFDVDRVHQQDHIRTQRFERVGPDDLEAAAGKKLAVLVRVDVDDGCQLFPEPQGADQRDALRSGTPDRYRLSALTRPLDDLAKLTQTLFDASREAVHELSGALEVVLLLQARRGGSGRRATFEHQVLAAVRLVEFHDVEARIPEEPGEGASREVRAVFVVNVPEHPVLKNSLHVGKLEEDVDVAPVADRLPHQPHEVAHRSDVLERVAAADVIGLKMRVLRAVEIADELDTAGRGRAGALGAVAWIDAYPVAAGALA